MEKMKDMKTIVIIHVLIGLGQLIPLSAMYGQYTPEPTQRARHRPARASSLETYWQMPIDSAFGDNRYLGTSGTDPMDWFYEFIFRRPLHHQRMRRQTEAEFVAPPHRSHQSKSQEYSSDGVHIDWVSYYASCTAPAYDAATALTLDDSGNVYVTGYSSGTPFGLDYLTAKYDSAGDQIWIARYDGPGNGDDFAAAVCVDQSGNVYVTGSCWSGESVDYATVKYNTEGVQQWVALYNGPGDWDDEAIALAIDASGNVYVTGFSMNSGTDSDYATVKYDSLGILLWVARFNGTGNGSDEPAAVQVDGAGNVYVTGRSEGTDNEYDFATIKYSSAGAEQWVKRQTSPDPSWDEATGLAVDDSGHVYVTGHYGANFATMKYGSDGEEEWMAVFEEPGRTNVATALTLDRSGSVYVTGMSDKIDVGCGYVTIKYTSEGTEEWVACYAMSEYTHNVPVALAVDDSGNVVVTGHDLGTGIVNENYITVRYNSIGEELWVKHYDGPANSSDQATSLAVDGSGNIYVGGKSVGSGTYFDYAIVKYSSEAEEQWAIRYDGQDNSSDRATDLAIDDSGNIYVTGGSEGDFATVKYDTDGTPLWTARYTGTGNSSDWPNALTIDGSGNVYVTGHSVGPEWNYDFITVKYDSSGDQQWVACYHNVEYSWGKSVSVVVDDSGNVYITGYVKNPGKLNDYATIKYNRGGVEQWVARYDGFEDSEDQATAMAVDNSGNVYVTGQSTGYGTGGDYATIKYDALGAEQWVARYNGPENTLDVATAIALDESGNIYVTGESDYGSFYATIKYNAAGEQQWVARYYGPRAAGNEPTGLAVDGLGSIYVTGKSLGAGADYATVKYNAAGEQQWVARYNSPENNYDHATALSLDGRGNVYVTGYSQLSASHDDYVTIKYDAWGVEQWTARYNGPGNSWDKAVALAVNDSGDVCVTGYCRSFIYWAIFSTIKYIQDPLPYGLKGDVNGDSTVDILDVVATIHHILNFAFLEGEALWRADCNGDTVINALDTLGIVNVILGIGECDP